jgi:hypothetical protein
MGVFDPCRQAGRFFRRGRGGEGDDEGEDDGGCVFVGRSRWRCIVPVLVVGCGHGGPGRERVSAGIGIDWRSSTLPFPRCARAHAGSRFPPSIGPDAENARVGCTPGRRPRAGVSTRFERGTAMTYAVLESILILYCFTMGGMHVHSHGYQLDIYVHGRTRRRGTRRGEKRIYLKSIQIRTWVVCIQFRSCSIKRTYRQNGIGDVNTRVLQQIFERRRQHRNHNTTHASPLHTIAGGGDLKPPPAGVWRCHAQGTLNLAVLSIPDTHIAREAHLGAPNPGPSLHTTMPIRTRPSLAASFRAAFLVPPLPRPKTSPSTSMRTAQIGVVIVPSATQSSYTHSTSRLDF